MGTIEMQSFLPTHNENTYKLTKNVLENRGRRKFIKNCLIFIGVAITTILACVAFCVVRNALEANKIKNEGKEITEITEINGAIEEFEKHKNFKLFNSQNCGPPFVGKRSQFGSEAAKLEFPWMVALFLYSLTLNMTIFGCGGSLIAENLVLTAAHCLPSGNITLKFIRLGEYDMREESEDVQDIYDFEIVPHPQWNEDGKQVNDIALIRLKTLAKLNQENIKTICLPFKKWELPAKIVVSGFGAKAYTPIHSEVLNKVSLDVIPNEKCTKEHKTKTSIVKPVTENQFCATGKTIKKEIPRTLDTCQFDSGSPAQQIDPKTLKTTQFGIVSWGENQTCGEDKTPGVYVKVQKYLGWILENAVSELTTSVIGATTLVTDESTSITDESQNLILSAFQKDSTTQNPDDYPDYDTKNLTY